MKRGSQAGSLFDREETHDTADTAVSAARGEQHVSGPTGAGSSRLVVSLHCDRPMIVGRHVALDRIPEVIVGRGSAEHIEHGCGAASLVVGGFKVSRQHMAIRRVPSGWELEDLGSKNGTIVNGERVDRAMLTAGDLIEVGETMLMFLQDHGPYREVQHAGVGNAPGPVSVFETLNTVNADLERRAREVSKIAPSRVPVLVRGETGTGKELMARAIHDASGRRGAFVAVNCGALPRDLIESELFGHRRGAFSGAFEEREGLVRRAHQGTLFLDEIAELPADSQVALLRVLQEGEVRPVGGNDVVRVDVRVVAATHQDILRLIALGRFRHDLYGRIAGYEVQLPALRHRREDLGRLIAAILPKVSARAAHITLHKSAARALFRYSWPLNIRELEHALHVAVGLSGGDEIQLEHLPSMIREQSPSYDLVLSAKDHALRDQLIDLLCRENGNIAAVARTMQRAPLQIRRWCSRLQIDVARFRTLTSGARHA